MSSTNQKPTASDTAEVQPLSPSALNEMADSGGSSHTPEPPQADPSKAGRNPLTSLSNLVTGPKGRWITLVVWLGLIGLMTAVAPDLAKYYDNGQTSEIGDQEAVRADTLLRQKFPEQQGLPAIIVFNNGRGLTQQDYQQGGQISQWLTLGQKPKAVSTVLSIYTVPEAKAQLVSANGTTMEIIASLTGSPGDESFSTQIEDIRKYLKQFDGKSDGLNIKLTGPAGVSADASLIFSSADLPLLLSTGGLVLVLLLVIYRSPLLAFLPLVAVTIAMNIVTGLLAFAAKAGWFGVTQQATSVMTILLFGAGTDYTIFIVSRYREELQHESDRLTGLRRATSRVNEAITSSAGTVIAALLTLLLTTLALYHSLGPTLALAVAVMLVAGLTLVPALLAIFGSWAFWPFVPKLDQTGSTSVNRRERKGFWNRTGGIATGHPVATVWISSLFLFGLGLGNLGVKDVYNFLTGFRQPTDSLWGYQYLAGNFPPGVLAPFDMVVNFKDGSNAYQKLQTLDRIGGAISRIPAVEGVSGPTRPTGKDLLAPDLAQLQQKLAGLPTAVTGAIRSGQPPSGSGVAGGESDPQTVSLYAQTVQYISSDNSTARLQVTLKSDPYGVPAIDSIASIRQAARIAANEAGESEKSVSIQAGGITPGLADTREVSNRDKLIVIPLVLALTALILGLLLRSVVAPIYLLIAVTLNFFAAMGLSSFLFTFIQGDDGRAYTLPLYTFIFLVALGADYTIFLMSRVREEVASYGLVEGTRDALSHTGGVITSAGLILAGTFLVLAILPIRELYQLGVTVAVGIVLDTFVVRGFLVPAVVVLLKKANWWPGKLPALTATPSVSNDNK